MLKQNAINKLVGKRVLLTGGTGFFGKSILSYLKRNPIDGMNITVLSRRTGVFFKAFPEFACIPGVDCMKGDVRCISHNSGHFDYVVHAATPAVVNLAPGEMASIIVDGTRHM